VISLTRQIKLFLDSTAKRRRYRAEQVYAVLRGRDGEVADPAISRMVERIPTILREPSVRKRYEGFQRYFDVLPRIVFMVHRGTPVSQIATDLSFLATEIGIETVLKITAQLLAERLNQAE
jgi:hypothetical protein